MHTPLVQMAGRLAPPQSDRELLARFVGGRDEAAFAALVHRHGPKGQLDVYATEDGLNKESDHFDPNKTARTEKFKTVYSVEYGGTPVGFVRFVGARLGTRMVWDAPLPAEPRVSWINHTVRNPSPEEATADRDPDRVLRVVAEQTGLTVRKERRKGGTVPQLAGDEVRRGGRDGRTQGRPVRSIRHQFRKAEAGG